MRCSVCLSIDQPENLRLFFDWLSRNSTYVSRISENTGCGCCVLLYNLEVSPEAQPIDETITATTEWTVSGAFEGNDSTVDDVLSGVVS